MVLHNTLPLNLSKQNNMSQTPRHRKLLPTYCVQDEDAGFALRWNEEAKQSLVALAVVIQVHVADTP